MPSRNPCVSASLAVPSTAMLVAIALSCTVPASQAQAQSKPALQSQPRPAHAGRPGEYALDPVHTRVQFAIDHAGYSRAIGTVSGSTGTIVFDPGDWSSARVDVTVPLGRLELGDDAWNRAAVGILDAGHHPDARFVSRRVEPVGPWAARVCGDLTMHGTTRDLCLAVQFNQLERYPLPPFHRVAGFSASGHLQRSDFGIDDWSSLVGDTVELRIEAEARYVGPAPAAQGTP